MPDGVLNVLPGFGETAGQALGRHMDVDKLAFTGSSEVGKLFLIYAGESNMKSVQLECGGKSPNVVFDDVPDIDLAVAQAAEGIFGNSGQVCSAGSRLLLQESIADEVLEKLAAEAGKWAPGDPLDPATRMGSMVDETQMDRVLGYIGAGARRAPSCGRRRPRARGDRRLLRRADDLRGRAQRHADRAGGDLRPGRDRDPVRLRGRRRADRQRHGLRPLLRASGRATSTRPTGSRARSAPGTVCINCYDWGDNSLPFGGYKQSGIGRDKSLHALENYTQLKTTYINVLED